ncbi:U-scoloptoxin(11)-Ssd2a-like [Uloborus diversus]|uniref:U-scoloptoxin(11)-Ssd2a-like n=1 Tax=Uloborus diversus TaxID=327109 RepID=UPI0024095E56|nr:U-scoloptoxin(11)-Ssd2a-like [Uloborus diversus]
MLHEAFFTVLLASALHFTVQTNTYQEIFKIEPTCERRSICGYLQLNGNSINVQTICKCQHNIPCPLQWNSNDGYTVTHGNDQYKFCELVRPLPPCTSTETAYASYLEMSYLTQETLTNSGYLYCSCPDNYLLLRNDSHFDPLENAIAKITTSYVCKPPPVCSLDNICAAITQNFYDDTSFVTRHCICPPGYYCPSSLEMAKEKVDLDKGSYYVMKCI